jgi:hypothetical protein
MIMPISTCVKMRAAFLPPCESVLACVCISTAAFSFICSVETGRFCAMNCGRRLRAWSISDIAWSSSFWTLGTSLSKCSMTATVKPVSTPTITTDRITTANQRAR